LGLADSDAQNLGRETDTAADMIFSLRAKAEIPAVLEPEPDGLCILRQSFKGADLASYLDAYVLLSHPYSLEVTETHSDDQVGHRALKATQRTMMPVQTEYYSRDEDVATAALRSFEGVLERSMPLDKTREIARWPRREEYRSRLWKGLKTDPALESLVDLPRLYLDYRPMIGMMVMAEDEEIERAAERVKGGADGRRRTARRDKRRM